MVVYSGIGLKAKFENCVHTYVCYDRGGGMMMFKWEILCQLGKNSGLFINKLIIGRVFKINPLEVPNDCSLLRSDITRSSRHFPFIWGGPFYALFCASSSSSSFISRSQVIFLSWNYKINSGVCMYNTYKYTRPLSF